MQQKKPSEKIQWAGADCLQTNLDMMLGDELFSEERMVTKFKVLTN